MKELTNTAPLVTAIVPVYNGEKYLDRCINSILDQTYPNIEIILVEGGSTDASPSMCDDWAKNKQQIQVLHQINEGVSHSRNTGMDMAKGDYITFVDADDYLREDMIEQLVQGLETENADVAGCHFFLTRQLEREERQVTPKESLAYQCLTPQGFIEDQFLKHDTRCWSKLYRRAVIEKVRFQKGLTIGEDMYFLLQVIGKADKILVYPDYQGYGYFVNPQGAMLRPFTEGAMDQILCWELVMEALITKQIIMPIDLQRAELILRRNLLMGILLTEARLVRLPIKSWKDKKEYFAICQAKMKAHYSHAVYQSLDRGYQIKVLLYRSLPQCYRLLYHYWKRNG